MAIRLEILGCFRYTPASNAVVLTSHQMMRCCRVFHCSVLAISLASVFACAAFAQSKQGAPAANPSYSAEVKDLTGRILKKAGKVKCHPDNCTVLVADVITPWGSTSRLGMQLADTLSAQIMAQGSGIQVVDRKQAEGYLAREHLESQLFKDRKALNWLGKELKAEEVLFGTIEKLGEQYSLKIELMNVSNEKQGPQEAVYLSISDPTSSFAKFEPYDAERQNTSATSVQSHVIVSAGVKGVGLPMCIYCPPPLYTKEGRGAKIDGAVVLLATVTEDGRAADIRVLKGMPFGMNEQAVKSVSEWKFKPSTDGDGKPIAVRVPIQITFRLY